MPLWLKETVVTKHADEKENGKPRYGIAAGLSEKALIRSPSELRQFTATSKTRSTLCLSASAGLTSEPGHRFRWGSGIPTLGAFFTSVSQRLWGGRRENTIEYRKGQLKTNKALVFKTKHFFLKGIHRLKETPLCLLRGHEDVLLLQGKPGASVGY